MKKNFFKKEETILFYLTSCCCCCYPLLLWFWDRFPNSGPKPLIILLLHHGWHRPVPHCSQLMGYQGVQPPLLACYACWATCQPSATLPDSCLCCLWAHEWKWGFVTEMAGSEVRILWWHQPAQREEATGRSWEELPTWRRKQEQRFWDVGSGKKERKEKGQQFLPSLGRKILELWVDRGIKTKGRHESIYRSKRHLKDVDNLHFK